MRDLMRVFIGYDLREPVVYHVCADSIIRNTRSPVSITPLHLPHIASVYEEKHADGSNAFIYSRFLVPYLSGYSGYSLYLDGDMVVNGDIAEMFERADPTKSVIVAQHPSYVTKAPRKYLGSPNENYPYKNWSSVMLFNCGHFHTRKLTPKKIMEADGAYLHRFMWTEDDRIGKLSLDWNWLVGEYERNPAAKLLHYTLGVPAFSEYQGCDHAEEWFDAYSDATHCAQSEVNIIERSDHERANRTAP